MSKNDHNPEEEQEQQIEEEEVAESTEETTEDSSELEALKSAKEAAEAEAAKYRRLFNKANRKEEPKKETPSEPTGNELSRADVEEMLLAKEYDTEELEEIKDIARGKGLSYAEAIATPVFQSWKEARDNEKRKQDASLGSSKGGAYSRSKEVPQDREAHKEWYLKNFG